MTRSPRNIRIGTDPRERRAPETLMVETLPILAGMVMACAWRAADVVRRLASRASRESLVTDGFWRGFAQCLAVCGDRRGALDNSKRALVVAPSAPLAWLDHQVLAGDQISPLAADVAALIARQTDGLPHDRATAASTISALAESDRFAEAHYLTAAWIERRHGVTWRGAALNDHIAFRVGERDVVLDVRSTYERVCAPFFLGQEPGMIDWILDFPPDAVFFDVGASNGPWSVLAAALRGARVVAIEPRSRIRGLLEENCRVNQVDHLVDVHGFAVGAEEGELTIHDATVAGEFDKEAMRAGIDASLRTFRRGRRTDVVGAIRLMAAAEPTPKEPSLVPVRRLGPLIAAGDLPMPTHLKIDIDADILPILDDLSAVIANPRLRGAMLESYPRGREYGEVIQVMARHGFSHYVFGKSKNVFFERR